MAPASTDPVYNMKVVAQETGIKPDTLRAWERRYGLPDPDRTSGGHRLYSQRDIEIIKWLMARQEEGLSISRAVELWRNLKAEGREPLRSMEYQPAEIQRTELPSDGTLAQLREAWISACLDFDEPQAERVLTQAFALYPQETVCIEILQKGMSQTGELWHSGDITVQQEHFTSALTIRRLNVLVEAAPAPTRPERILIGCPPGEEHTFSPLLITLMLRRAGWGVRYLGANVPRARFETAVKTTNSDLVILTAQQLHTAGSLLDVAQLLQAEEVALGFGGLIFNRTPALRDRIPGHFLGERLEDTVPAVEQMLTLKPSTPDVEPVPESFQDALTQYREQQAEVEAHVWDTLKTNNISYADLATANMHLARDIVAALKLGNMDFLGPEIVWVKSMMIKQDMEPALLFEYLSVYHEAVETVMDEGGRLIAEWLARVEENNSEEEI